MKAVTLLVNSLLPPDLRDDKRVLDKRGMDNLLAEVAKRYPDKYSDIVQGLSDIGRNAAYMQGETLTLRDMRPVLDKDGELANLDAEVAKARSIAKTPEEFDRIKMKLWSDFATRMDTATVDAAKATGNNLANTVVSGARGNPFQLKAMITTPALYTDYKDRPIPMLVRHSFGQGLRPAEYLASTYGVRRGVLSTKNATADSGDLAKQMVQSAASLIVSDDDCGTTNGLDLDPQDPDIAGRVLARSYKGIPAGTVIDKAVARKLQTGDLKKILVRSPMTCQAKEGICAHCLGTLPNGKFAPKGYAAGVTAAQAISEPLTQGALTQKHGGGGFTGEKKTFSGFKVIDQLVQSPETFPFKAAVATVPGKVESIEEAPQGGTYINIAGTKHYALPGYEVQVKPGDEVEAGDQLSEGIVDVSDLVQHRGLGEARRYYVDRLRQALEESGAGKASKLNLELMARAALDHVRVDSLHGLGDYLPDDIASYNRIASNYQPDPTTKLRPLEEANGQYLQVPTLHFTIGTKLSPKMLNRIRESGINHVPVSQEEPKFVPEMRRLRSASHSGQDWLAKMHSSYLTTNLSNSAARALDTNLEENTHFAPRLAVGKGFGEKVETTGKF